MDVNEIEKNSKYFIVNVMLSGDFFTTAIIEPHISNGIIAFKVRLNRMSRLTWLAECER